MTLICPALPPNSALAEPEVKNYLVALLGLMNTQVQGNFLLVLPKN